MNTWVSLLHVLMNRNNMNTSEWSRVPSQPPRPLAPGSAPAGHREPSGHDEGFRTPSVLRTSEGTTSDAFTFPQLYSHHVHDELISYRTPLSFKNKLIFTVKNCLQDFLFWSSTSDFRHIQGGNHFTFIKLNTISPATTLNPSFRSFNTLLLNLDPQIQIRP